MSVADRSDDLPEGAFMHLQKSNFILEVTQDLTLTSYVRSTSFRCDRQRGESLLVDAVKLLAGLSNSWRVDDRRKLLEIVDDGVKEQLCIGARKLLQNFIALQVI